MNCDRIAGLQVQQQCVISKLQGRRRPVVGPGTLARFWRPTLSPIIAINVTVPRWARFDLSGFDALGWIDFSRFRGLGRRDAFTATATLGQIELRRELLVGGGAVRVRN